MVLIGGWIAQWALPTVLLLGTLTIFQLEH
jgi:hypothetical protein